MSAPTLGLCCISGAIHEGTPKGTVEEFGGVKTYVALPSGEYDSTTALLFLPDVFGLELPNAKLLADSFAQNGIATYIVDLFNGEALPADALNDGTFPIMEWLGAHGQSVTRPILDKAIEGLKSKGIKTFAATGYCYGGRYVADLAIDNVIKVAVVAHPSLLKVPEDLELINKKSTAPFLWNIAVEDNSFDPAAADIADKVFEGNKLYKRIDYPGCAHGFAVRGDMSIPAVKAGKEAAFKASVDFLKAHL